MKLQKETINKLGLHGRWYGDACGTAFGMELLGERWSLLIVRELMFGPRRFTDIRANLPAISAKVLTERLAGLETTGVIVRTNAPEPVPAQLYGLTEWGYAAEPLVQEIGRWAAASPLHDPTLPLSPASFMLSLRTMLDSNVARDLDVTAVFEIGSARFTARLERGEMPIQRGETAAPDLTFSAVSAQPLAAVFYGDMAALDAGVMIEGRRDMVRPFTDCFSLPAKHSE